MQHQALHFVGGGRKLNEFRIDSGGNFTLNLLLLESIRLLGCLLFISLVGHQDRPNYGATMEFQSEK